ncbi:MAG TPA: TonB-dependent receptor [Terriglobales bacterium]|nr:TonB-dependent receptor [Terriglobales bacterium]
MKIPAKGLGFALCAMSALGFAAPQATQEAKEAADLDLEQLANVEVKVTSASKKAESLNQAPAAIYVITGEEIRRGGFSSVPEALRTVPGLYVAQEDAHSWIVAARGFSYAFNDKMLVLLDGRLLYQPLFGGVYWDTIDPPLEDIDRIEIIRGPGGTLWGANAVNGVINIITKKSQETQSWSIATSAGIYEMYKASVRYGGKIGDKASYRIYGQTLYGDASVDGSGVSQENPWNLNQAGVRLDWQISPKDKFSFDGGGFRGTVHTGELNFSAPGAGAREITQTDLIDGGHIQGRWAHQFNDRSDIDVLSYCDWSGRVDILSTDIRSTCDVEVQHDFKLKPRHSVIWGGSILSTAATPSDTFEISYSPPRRRDTTYSVFGQYEVSVVPDTLRIIGGAKFEHNPYTGFEIQPQIRAVWTPDKLNTLWGAISRAVKVPGELNSDADLKVSETDGGPLPVFAALKGNPDLDPEILRAYELGYRYQPHHGYSFDVSAFYNDYSDLINTGPPGAPILFPTYIEVPLPFVNSGPAQTHGLEFSVELRPISRWSVSSGLTEVRGLANPQVTQGLITPRHIVNLQSRFDLARHFSFDTSYYYTGEIPDLGLHSINRVDVGMSTRQFDGFTFSVWGRNLQSDHHLENNSGEPYVRAGEIRRSVVLKLVWQQKQK